MGAHPCHLLSLFFVLGAVALIGSTFTLTWTSTTLGAFVTINGKLFQVCEATVAGNSQCRDWSPFLDEAVGRLFCNSPGDPSASNMKVRVQLVEGFVICAMICALIYLIGIALHSFKCTTTRWHWVIANILSLCFGLAALVTWATFVYQCDSSFCDMMIPVSVHGSSSNGASSSYQNNVNTEITFCTPDAGTWLAVVAGGILLTSLFPMLIFNRPGVVAPVVQTAYQPLVIGSTPYVTAEPATVQVVVQQQPTVLPDYYAPPDKQGY